MLESFHFIRPWWLLLLIPSMGLLWLLWRRRDVTRAWSQVMDPHLLAVLMSGKEDEKPLRPLTLLAAMLVLGAVALAGPTWSFEPSPFAEDQAALVILLKVSPSMDEQDVQPSRAERAVQKIQDLLKLRTGARTALIAYSGSAHLVMPLTKDAGVINTFASALSPKVMPEEGDDVLAAYALAEKELQRAKVSGSVVVITDTLSDSVKFGKTPVQVLGVVGVDGLGALKEASEASGARFVPVSIDDSDVNELENGVQTSFAAMPSDDGAHWKDQGYWLLPLMLIGALFWFRSGWKIS